MFIFKSVYVYFMTLPDRLYPFAAEISGKRVRGRRSYQKALRSALKRYGIGRMGYKLAFYREIFHFIGSVLFIAFATLLSRNLFGNEISLYVLFTAAILALSYQEFYLHPRTYGQHPAKGIVDWLAWVVPMITYLFLFK